MRFVRWVIKYFLFFFACMVVVAIAMTNVPAGIQMLFAFVTPGLLVWWHEKRREKRLAEKNGIEAPSRVALAGESEQLNQPKPYQPRQNNAELIRAGQQARAELEVAAERRSAEKLARQSQSNQFLDQHSQPKKPKENPSTRSQGWVPKGQSVTIAGRTIDGMVYVGKPPRIGSSYYGEVCRAYIDPSLSVAHVGTDKNGDNMSYWPGYSSIPAVCRATYLDWLAGGRQDRTINPGYMFLFFYGLERRFLVDEAPESEKRDILVEVGRLKELFSTNHSAQRYLGEFIDLASIIVDDADFKKPIYKNWGWELPLSLKVALGGAIANDMPIDADWLLSWFMCHNEKRLRTPATRCENEFMSLFRHKFAIRFPSDLTVSKPRKHLEYSYRAASGEFGGNIPISANGKPILDISGLRKPVEIAQEIADEAMDELDKFSRYIGRNPDGRGTIEAQALLPAELWSLFPSSELEELKDWAREQVAAGGLVPALDVISRLEGEKPEKLGKRNLTGAADALARIGFGMAPDPRFSLRGPKIDEPVVIFELGEPIEQLEDVSPAYRTELFELALATFVAHADSKIVEAERRALREKIEAVGGLTELERKRLYANLEWYLDVPPDMSWLRSKLKDADAEHHLALRAAVVAIAHADSVIQSEEVACIEKIYKALGIDAGLVYADLHAGDVPDGPVRVKAAEAEAPGEQIPDEPKAKAASLDAARIAAIRNDTERVSSVLGEIFSTDEDVSDEATAANALPSSMAGLAPKHAMLVEQIIQREHWTGEEFDEIAGKQGLMPSGALEVVNEWAFDKFDEPLLDEYDGYDVSPDITATLRAEMAKGD
ncbi:plasma membrane H+-transporting two-sector ATPase C subunit [Croceicoccus pelagius]|uniref:Plasma membrane H+-transporting two-sector ATPase C subunit n=1 Tax=Croceicoccus pelagius TaxID=1703341 RepID=A0A917DI41_9SPHN|nr:plasma membrane H+-transporting two-sector ATPase C subunit [Croceicoccus pelagius]